MDLRQLSYFVAVYEMKSISAASYRLHVAQPAVSRSLQALSADLGVVLFEKHGRGIHQTVAADRLYVHARQILHDVETTKLHVQAAEESPVGHVNFACTDQLGRIMTPTLLAKYHKEYPQVTISIWEGTAATVYDWVVTGVVDVALLTSPAPSPVVQVWGKRKEPMFVIMASEWKGMDFAHLIKENFTISDIAELPLILPRRGNSHRAIVETAMASIRRSPNVVFEVDGVSTINALVGRGLGCTVLIQKALEYEMQLGLLVSVPIELPGIWAEISVLSPRDRLRTRATQALIDILLDPDTQSKAFEDTSHLGSASNR